MAFRSFSIGPIAGLRSASASALPDLVVVAGPNGSGKSTLLYQLYQRAAQLAEPGTRVSYLGPHRTWRKSNFSGAVLSEFYPSLSEYLQHPTIPGWKIIQPQGFQHVAAGLPRDHAATDDTFTFVKPAIINLDRRLQVLLRKVWEGQGHRISPGDVPDLLDPLRNLVRKLLPHLTLEGIDSSSEQNLRVLFQRIDGSEAAIVELDDLSSGEKAIVGIGLALIEPIVEQLVGHGPDSLSAVPSMIIDEPEIHLHPTLQVLLVEHLAELAANGKGQFIIATQSPTIIDALDDDSLFLLAPTSAVPEGNQVVPIGRAQPKLELMRSLTGSTHLLTRCRPIVFLEGEAPAARPISDQRLIEILIPEAQGWVLISAGGRGNAVAAARQLREATQDSLPGVPVFALVDKDQGLTADEDFVITWPVSMIENLLLDAEAIWSVLEPHRELLSLNTPADVASALLQIAEELGASEVRLRVKPLQNPISTRVRADSLGELAGAIEAARTELNQLLDQLKDSNQTELEFQRAEAIVEGIRQDNRQLEAFRGKEIFKRFHTYYVKPCGFSFKAFAYAVARAVNRGPRLASLTTVAVRRIERYVPIQIVGAVEFVVDSLGDSEEGLLAAAILERLSRARTAWEVDGNVQEDLEELRNDVLSLARQLPPHLDRADELITAAAQLGLRSALVQ